MRLRAGNVGHGEEVTSSDFKRVLKELQRHGLLLRADTAFPNVALLVAREPIRGSWWAHARAHEIYDVSHSLEEHPDVIVTKLVSGKDTYVHRDLWPAIMAIGRAREAWQVEGLSAIAQHMLEAVDEQGELRTDDIPRTSSAKKDSPGEAARQLERRLLVHSDEVHTESGAHAKRLEAWERWAKRAGMRGRRVPVERAKRQLEEIVAELNKRFEAKGRLPWHGSRS